MMAGLSSTQVLSEAAQDITLYRDAAMRFTVLGASGFIGSHLMRWLESQSLPYWAPKRCENVLGRPLGHVIYCIGLTADFRGRPYDTVRAHVCHLLDILEEAEFASF